MDKVKLRDKTIRYIEQELEDYQETKRKIEERKQELQAKAPVEAGMPMDRQGPSSPTERLAIRMLSDRHLQEMERVIECIEHVYQHCDADHKRLILIRYWTKPQTLTWEGIARELAVSKRQAYRWRDNVVHAIADRLGMR